ncbi:unnamed protein product, partial [Scytosiphon promiscuus]
SGRRPSVHAVRPDPKGHGARAGRISTCSASFLACGNRKSDVRLVQAPSHVPRFRTAATRQSRLAAVPELTSTQSRTEISDGGHAPVSLGSSPRVEVRSRRVCLHGEPTRLVRLLLSPRVPLGG